MSVVCDRIDLVEKVSTEKGFQVKFYIRRAVLGIIIIPVVAGLYTFAYLWLILAGAEPTVSSEEVFNNGLWLGVLVAVMLTFSPQVSKLLNRIIGE